MCYVHEDYFQQNLVKIGKMKKNTINTLNNISDHSTIEEPCFSLKISKDFIFNLR